MNIVGLLTSFVLSLYLACHVDTAVIEPILSLQQGKIKGKVADSRTGKNFVQYLGIPYAKKPERFKVSPINHDNVNILMLSLVSNFVHLITTTLGGRCSSKMGWLQGWNTVRINLPPI
jgi:hypothetical protein